MIRIAVATHMKYDDIPDDPIYVPVAAGAALGWQVPGDYARDDSGDNISDRNGMYSELSVLYWMWKNPELFSKEADSVGLCHYRRYFAVRKGFRKFILTEETAEEILTEDSSPDKISAGKIRIGKGSARKSLTGFTGKRSTNRGLPEKISTEKTSFDGKVILPQKRNYVFESNYTQYAHSHNSADLDAAGAVIAEKYPEYLPYYDRRMAMRTGHRFNMFIMPRDKLDAYCSWLFDILFEVEKRLDVSGYTGRDRRVFGLISERLLDVWLDANDIKYIELPYVMTEREHLLVKGVGMMHRKLRAGAKKLKSRKRD